MAVETKARSFSDVVFTRIIWEHKLLNSSTEFIHLMLLVLLLLPSSLVLRHLQILYCRMSKPHAPKEIIAAAAASERIFKIIQTYALSLSSFSVFDPSIVCSFVRCWSNKLFYNCARHKKSYLAHKNERVAGIFINVYRLQFTSDKNWKIAWCVKES